MSESPDTSSFMERSSSTRPVVTAAIFLGLGLGGFLDGILLHQILQWHQMISARLPPDTLAAAKVNMFWDGIFHAGTWTFTFIGVILLARTAGHAEKPHSPWLLAGGMILGWGVFNLMDSIFNHYLFNFHNVRENVPNPQLWNHGFLLLSLIQIAGGGMMVRHGRAGGPGQPKRRLP